MRQEQVANPHVVEQRAGESKLLSRLYREVGLAAVAAELDLQANALEPDLAAAIERGALLLAPRRSIVAA